MRAAVCALLAASVAASTRVVDKSMLRAALPEGAPSLAKRVGDGSYNTTLALSRVYSAGIAYCPSDCINDW